MIDITQIIVAIIAVLGAVITAILIPYIRSRTTTDQQAKLQTWVNVAVYAAEQIFAATGAGAIKKKYVLNFLQAQGITYDAAAIDALIEAAVRRLNIQQGETTTTTSEAAAEDAGDKPPGADNDYFGKPYII